MIESMMPLLWRDEKIEHMYNFSGKKKENRGTSYYECRFSNAKAVFVYHSSRFYIG